MIPPRIVRLLENPAMMRAFVECAATGAIEKRENPDDGASEWIWHSEKSDKEFILTDRSKEPDPNIIRAAVVFVLQQRESGLGLRRITLQDAVESAVACAQKNHKETKKNVVKDFIANQLDDYLNEHFPSGDEDRELHERERKSLKLVFEFYADPKIGTGLTHFYDFSIKPLLTRIHRSFHPICFCEQSL